MIIPNTCMANTVLSPIIISEQKCSFITLQAVLGFVLKLSHISKKFSVK